MSAEAYLRSSQATRFSIAYDKIKKIEYHKEVAFHLGVAPAIVVGLIKKRERKHFFTITYTDEAGVRQAAVFEVAKDAPSVVTCRLCSAGSAGMRGF
jgi:hypothetical protein